MNQRRLACCLFGLGALSLCLAVPPPAPAYIGGPPLSLGLMCSWSTHVMIARVERADREKSIVIFKKVRDVKGTWPSEVIRHHFNANLPNRGYVMDRAEPGKTVVMCALESYKWSHTYIDGEWYAANTGDWQFWNVSHAEPLLLRMYAGKSERLADAVGAILAGKEVVVPGMVDGPVETLAKRTGKYQRLKASLTRSDYNPKRDFVGWGKDDFAPLAGMPGFSQMASLGKLGADVQAMCCADFDGDGKPDLCLVSSNRVVVILNGGDYFSELPLPGLEGGCRSVVAADYNGDGKPDLLLATPSGPRLYTNLGNGTFKDDTALLPKEEVYNLTAAAWIDYDGDGWPDILLANGVHGLRLYRNRGPEHESGVRGQESGGRSQESGNKQKAGRPTPGKPMPARPSWFEDRSDVVGLGANGAGSGIKGDTLTVCDVNGDGWPDFLYGAGHGMLFLNSPRGFVVMKNSGIRYTPGKVGPIFADFNGDGIPDLFVPQKDGCKLFLGDGQGRFRDATATSGDLAKFDGWATCAAAGDVDNDGHLDLVLGCLRGPNRCFRNKGDGTFEDGTDKIGLDRKLFNTQALAVVDLNGDGALDMVFANEGQEAVALLSNPEQASKRTPLTLTISGKDGVIGSRVQVFQEDRLVQTQDISGGEGKTQPPAQARFALEPGKYRVEVRYSSGVVRAREITVARAPLRGKIDEQTARTGE